MEARYTKTEAGREEIRSRARGLSRTVRNLLLMIDGNRNSAYLVEHLQGVTQADLEQLAAAGLIEAVVMAAVPAPVAVLDVTLDSQAGVLTAPVEPEPEPVAAALVDDRTEDRDVLAAIEALSYQKLYKLLTDQARDRLGMIRGYKLALDVERTQSLEGMQQLALQFVSSVRELRGPVVASELRRDLQRLN
jgi:hypothetical protein